MRKSFIMALVAIMLMSQLAHARMFDRLRARRPATKSTVAATADGSGKVTPAPTTSSPAPAPPKPAAAPAPPAPPK